MLDRDDAGDARRSDVERLLRDGERLLVCDGADAAREAYRMAASAVLGQLRGGPAVQLVLSMLASTLNSTSGERPTGRHLPCEQALCAQPLARSPLRASPYTHR